MKRRLTVVVALLALWGCLPKTVSVSPEGRIAFVREEGVVVYDPAKGEAAIVARPGPEMKAGSAAFSPDGKKLLWAITTGPRAEGEGAGSIFVGEPDGTHAREIYRSENCLVYITWSPDAKRVAVGRMVRSAALQTDVVAFAVVDPTTGKVVEIATDTTQIHHWTPDSKGIVTFCPRTRVAGGNGRGVRGQLARFDLNGTKTVLAEAITTWDLCLDLSSDGKRGLLTAGAVGPPDAEDLHWDQGVLCRAYVLDLGTGKTQKVAEERVDTALFSPDDKHILCGRFNPARLVVCKADGTEAKVLAPDISIEREDFRGRMVPAWLSNDTVAYWDEDERLTFVKIDGSGTENVQAKLDALLK